MNTQLTISFDAVHRIENNPKSQAILNEMRDDFNQDCWEIMKVLLKGETVTNLDLINRRLTMSPTRRISDLGEYGIIVSREMRTPIGTNTKVMHYWLTTEEINRVMLALVDGLRFEKKKAA